MSAKSSPAAPAFLEGIAPAIRHYLKKQFIFRQGDEVSGLFLLVKGKVILTRVTPCGNEVTTHTARPGELFAEAAMFVDRYHCDALALEDCEVHLFPKAALKAQFAAQPQALWTFAAELAHRVQHLRTRVELSRIRSAPQRVLQALQLRSNADGECKLEGNLKQFAADIGLTHEALYRALGRLERQGMITRADTSLRLLRP